MSLLTDPPDLHHIRAEYARRGLDQLDDVRLVAAVSEVVRRPRVQPADSFVLHSPLELCARTTLLPRVAPAAREAARLRIVAMAAQLHAFGPAVDEPAGRSFDSTAAAAGRLVEVIEAGDLDEVDAVARWLGRAARAPELARLLADAIVPRTGAAAHGPIFLHLLPRVAPRGELGGELLRQLARELAREPTWRLRWIERVSEAGLPGGDASSLMEALAASPQLGPAASSFIHPVMIRVDENGVAEQLLAGPVRQAALPEAACAVMRAAAFSMLQEPDDHAPYGWSHCLTMPQAVLALALNGSCGEARAALAVAATHVVGFRTAMAHRPLDPSLVPADPRMSLAAALEAGPDAAAGAAWHTPDSQRDALISELCTRASVQRDAHLVKYTLACVDAADWDRPAAHLYLAGAAKLVAYWRRRGDPADPLA
jgi:hypothetical protein